MAVLGDRIRALRQRRGWTLRDLARETTLSVPYLSDIERKREVNPTLDSLKTIARALECPVTELLGDDTEAGVGRWHTPLPVSLQRFIGSPEFASHLSRVAARTGRSPESIEPELVNFLASAPKRSSGDLGPNDWKRLLDLYTFILDGP